MKKKILLGALLGLNMLAPTVSVVTAEEVTKVKTETSTHLTTPEDFYKLGLTFKLFTSSNPNSNDWISKDIPIDSKVKLSISNTSTTPGMENIQGMAYIENIKDFLPTGYVEYSSLDKTSMNLISISSSGVDTPQIWAVSAPSFSTIQNTAIQFISQDGKAYSLPIKEGLYTPVSLFQVESTLYYTINLRFADYQKDLEALVGTGTELNVMPGYVGFVPEGYYQINIRILENGNSIHNLENDPHQGVPFTTTNTPVTPSEPTIPFVPEEKKALYRLYHQLSGEHFFTTNLEERNQLLTDPNWKEEGLGWTVPEVSDSPVYCVVNPHTHDHHFTIDQNEYETLKSLGWIDDGIRFYAAGSETQYQNLVPLYRLYNPNHKGTGSHHYTADENERDTLVKQGWNNEGIAWHGFEILN